MLEVEQKHGESFANLNKSITSKIKHPLFQLEQRPDVIEAIYKDAMMTFMSDKNIELYAPRSEDYLDDTKFITEDFDRALNIKINFIRREREEKAKEAEMVRIKL